eukprot:scaffold14_cov380-Prasinococcus_capsulatus_cf.AAC.14
MQTRAGRPTFCSLALLARASFQPARYAWESLGWSGEFECLGLSTSWLACLISFSSWLKSIETCGFTLAALPPVRG